MSKKKDQLGMNPSTASGRLVKDLLFDFICKTEVNQCSICGNEMKRNNFSIDHIEPWLDSDNPKGLYFDLSNISYSHLSCNINKARKPHKKYTNEEEQRRESNKRYYAKNKDSINKRRATKRLLQKNGDNSLTG